MSASRPSSYIIIHTTLDPQCQQQYAGDIRAPVHFICICNKDYLCPALLRLFSCSLSDWRRLTGARGRQPQVSLLSLDSLPPEPEQEQASATNNVLYHGALIKQLTTFTQVIFTQDELNHVLFLKLNLLQTDKRNRWNRNYFSIWVLLCTECTGLPQQVAALCTLTLLSFPLSLAAPAPSPGS